MMKGEWSLFDVSVEPLNFKVEFTLRIARRIRVMDLCLSRERYR